MHTLNPTHAAIEAALTDLPNVRAMLGLDALRVSERKMLAKRDSVTSYLADIRSVRTALSGIPGITSETWTGALVTFQRPGLDGRELLMAERRWTLAAGLADARNLDGILLLMDAKLPASDGTTKGALYSELCIAVEQLGADVTVADVRTHIETDQRGLDKDLSRVKKSLDRVSGRVNKLADAARAAEWNAMLDAARIVACRLVPKLDEATNETTPPASVVNS